MTDHRFARNCLLALLLGVAALATPAAADAGCDCQKPPPSAEIRPRAAYAADPVSFFSPALVDGAHHNVAFAASADGPTARVHFDESLRGR